MRTAAACRVAAWAAWVAWICKASRLCVSEKTSGGKLPEVFSYAHAIASECPTIDVGTITGK